MSDTMMFIFFLLYLIGKDLKQEVSLFILIYVDVR